MKKKQSLMSKKEWIGMSGNMILLYIMLINSFVNFGQSSKTIFAEGKRYVYQAVFISPNGDTLTNEQIDFSGSDISWDFQKKVQSTIRYDYYPDTINLKNFVHPRKAFEKRKRKNLRKKMKGKKSWANYTWISKVETTGKIITDSSIWIHPPRSNQYVYHYMNAYP